MSAQISIELVPDFVADGTRLAKAVRITVLSGTLTVRGDHSQVVREGDTFTFPTTVGVGTA